jgi:hypothetical protein
MRLDAWLTIPDGGSAAIVAQSSPPWPGLQERRQSTASRNRKSLASIWTLRVA